MSNSSENEKIASGEGQEELQRDSVLDFLYHDALRVGSFLAQFDDAGHLQGLTESETVAKRVKRSWKFSLGGGIPEAGASGEAAIERGPAEGGSKTSERVYDPFWTNALTLLDYLEVNGLIQGDISQARIGQFVLVKGNLIVLDVTLIKDAWALPAFKARILGGVDQAAAAKAAQAGQEISSDQLAEAHAMIELLSVLPHSTQAQILTGKGSVWCSLASESLVGLSTDLVLKHGSHVPGEWSALGVLDAQPDFRSDPSNPTTLSGVEQAIVGVAGTLVGATIAQLAPITRNLLGRPRTAFGMTPLVIYREVSG